jgi:hypothetical protein
MKKNIYRVLAVLPGLLMGLNAVGWVVNPENTAKSLGMPLLEGTALSTQMGDIGALFVGTTLLVFMGAIRAKGHWLYAAAILLGSAAIMRTTATLLYGATFATVSISFEVIMTLWLCSFAYLIDNASES